MVISILQQGDNSILDYGAIPNDATASGRAANDAALAAARAASSSVYFPSQDGVATTTIYHFDTPVVLGSRESWHGDGIGSVQLEWHGIVTTEAILTLANYVTLEGFQLVSDSGLGYGISFNDTNPGGNAARCQLQNIRVSNCEVGYRLNNCWIMNFYNCHADNHDVACVQFAGGTLNANNAYSWIGGEFSSSPIGVDLQAQCKGMTFKNCTFENLTNVGIKLSTNNLKEAFVSEGNYFEFNTNGHVLVTGRTMGLQVTENYFACTSASMVSVELDADLESRPINHTVISGNNIRNETGPTNDYIFTGLDCQDVLLVDAGGSKVTNPNLASVEPTVSITDADVKWAPTRDYASIFDRGNFSGTHNVDFSADQRNSKVCQFTLTGNPVITLIADTIGTYWLRVIQDSTGGRKPAFSNLEGVPYINKDGDAVSMVGPIFYDGSTFQISKDEYEVNVVDHGADPTGVADSTTAIQAAIDYAVSLANGETSRPTVYFPPGQFLTSSQINIYNHIQLRGDSRSGSRIVFDPAAAVADEAAIYGDEGVDTYLWWPVIRDLTIRITESNPATNRYGIRLLNSTRALIENCRVEFATAVSRDWAAIRINREQPRVRNCSLIGPIGLWLDGGDNGNFHDMTYLASGQSTATLPRAAIYSPAGVTMSKVSFTGNHTVVGYQNCHHYQNTASNVYGLEYNNFRHESAPAGSTAEYSWDFGGTGLMYNLTWNNCRVETNVSGWRIGDNMQNAIINSPMYAPSGSGNVAFKCNGLRPANYGSFEIMGGWYESGHTVELGNFSRAAKDLNTQGLPNNSRDWLIEWLANETSYQIFGSFSRFKTDNSSATNITSFPVSSGAHWQREVSIEVDANTTIVHGTGTNEPTLSGGTNFAGPGTIRLRYDGTNWLEVSRSTSTTSGSMAANVLDYGADGSGSNDSSAAIQAAIDTDKDVYIPAGTYAVGSTLNMNNNQQTLFGDGAQSVLEAQTGNNLVVSVTGNDVRLEKFVIDGSSNARLGVQVQDNAADCSIENVEIHTLSSATANTEGILIGDSCDRALVSKCYIHGITNTNSPTPDATRGIRVSGTTTGPVGVKLINNTIEDVGPRQDGDGIVVQGFTTDPDILIDGNSIRRCSKRGIKLQNGGVTIKGNKLYLPFKDTQDPACAIAVQIASSNVLIQGNTIDAGVDGFADACILLNSTGSNIVVDNNIITVGSGHGNASCDGIQIDAAGDNIGITNNHFSSDFRRGLECTVAATNVRVIGNHWDGCSDDVVRPHTAAVTGWVVAFNTYSNKTGSFFDDFAAGATRIVLMGNMGDQSGGVFEANTTGDIISIGNEESIYDVGNTGASETVNFKGNGRKQKATLNSNCTIDFTNPPAGTTCDVELHLIQDATGGRIVTWGTIPFSGAEPTVLTDANQTTVIKMTWDGTNYHTFS